MARRLIIVSNRLPVSVHEESGAFSLSRSNGGLATALASLFNQDSSLWVGWTGFRRHLTYRELENLDFPSYLTPVNLPHAQINQYYDQFANGILWPLAHGIPPTALLTGKMWHEVKAATKRFADAVEATLRPSDVIWVHDYHLMLLPGELRRRGIQNRIGFFLHTPFFPAASLPRVPRVKELLASLCSADLIGLQVARDVRRFRQAASTLGLTAPAVASFPIGIDFASFDSLATDPEVSAKAHAIQKEYAGKTLIYSLSRLDYTKGILTQLAAFADLLGRLLSPEKIIYRLNVAPSRESALEYRALRESIEAAVSSINARYAWRPVAYTYENIGMRDMSAWYQAADIHLNTPVADGMNLIAKEYIAARHKPGVLIISSTMGAATQLKDALIVPPENATVTADALSDALKMPEAEKARRWQSLRHEVQAHQVDGWGNDFLEKLEKQNRRV